VIDEPSIVRQAALIVIGRGLSQMGGSVVRSLAGVVRDRRRCRSRCRDSQNPSHNHAILRDNCEGLTDVSGRSSTSASGTQAAASAVERDECPQCQAPAGSPCRTRSGTTAAKYHTARLRCASAGPAAPLDLSTITRGPVRRSRLARDRRGGGRLHPHSWTTRGRNSDCRRKQRALSVQHHRLGRDPVARLDAARRFALLPTRASILICRRSRDNAVNHGQGSV
jgi:hypothetical protein